MENGKRTSIRKAVAWVAVLGLIPAAIALGVVLLRDRRYGLVSMAVAALACVPFLLRFEK
jgi:hypothetical protein